MSESLNHLFDAFSKTAATYGSQPAITFKDHDSYQNLTYNDLYQKVIQLGNFLKTIGIGPQDRVALTLGNQPEYVISFFAIMYVEAIAVPLDSQFSATIIRNIIAHCGAKLLMTTQAMRTKIKADINNLQIVMIDSEIFKTQLKNADFNSTFKLSFSRDSLAMIFYTSGTTELPKGVMLSHTNLLTNVQSIQKLQIVHPGDGVISILPLHHAYPFTVTLLTPLLSGARIVYSPSLNSADLLACLSQEKIAIFVGVPQIFSQIHRSIDIKIKKLPLIKRILVNVLKELFYFLRKNFHVNLSKRLFKEIHKTFGQDLRFMVSGGARLDPAVALDFLKWGFTILEGYGLTETSPVVSFNPPGKPKIGSVGKPVANVEIKIIDPDQSGIGEVSIRGPNVMVGYYDLPEQTNAVLKDHWFYTGDLGFIDGQGYLYLVGRKKDIIVLSNGKKINPEKVEKHYTHNLYVKEIAVLATQAHGPFKGIEQLGAIVVINEDQFRSAHEINIHEKLKWEFENLSIQLPTYERITGFVISKENLPRTRLGKIMRYRLPELYNHLSEAYTPPLPPSSATLDADKTDSTLFAVHQFEEIIGKRVNLNDHLELDLGLDSLGRIELLLNLQERLNLKVSDEENMEFFMCQTVSELANQLKKFIPENAREAKDKNAPHWPMILKELPSEGTLHKIKTTFNWWEILINLIFITFFKLFFKIFFFLRTEGRNHLPQKRPYILCPNHSTYLDGLIIFSSLPYSIVLNTYFVGYNAVLEKAPIRSFVKIGRLIPIEVSFNLVEAFKACSFVLRHSKILCYFPEGQRSIDGELIEFKKGIGILVKELAVPVVPVYIEGAFRAWSRGQRFPKLACIKVKFGPIVTPQDLGSTDTSLVEGFDIYQHIAKNLQRQVLNLKTKMINTDV